MPITPSPAQSEASRHNGARSAGPVTAAGKARSALNSVRHGLCGRTFFLLPDEDPEEFKAHEATWLAAWRPRDFAEQDAALVAIRALWREIRADRLEAEVLADLFAAGGIADEAERQAAKAAGDEGAGHGAALPGADRARVRRRDARARRAAPAPPRPAAGRATERTRAVRPAGGRTPSPPAVPDEPERGLNRHQRRALAAMERQEQRRAA